MIDIKRFREYLVALTNRVNSTSEDKIDNIILAVKEEHIVKKLQDKSGISLCVSYPDAEGDASRDPSREDNQVFFFLCERVSSGEQTDEDEILFYAKIQSIMQRLLHEIYNQDTNCSFVTPDENYRLEWEYQIFGGYNGMSLGIKIKSYG